MRGSSRHTGDRLGKLHAPSGSGARYPAMDRFLAVRARLDPDGLFLDDHLRRLLGTDGS
jgi:FAD/FMN-containing dehydrogenase